MMKILFFMSITFISLTSCSIQRHKVTGQYNSTCALYGKSSVVVVKINNDGTFSYTRPYVEEDVVGTWEVVKDTLILKSDDFIEPSKDEFAPRVKYTEAKGRDVYLIKGKSLLVADKAGFTKDCYLLKVK